MENKTRASLLTLPTEIRNAIYELVFPPPPPSSTRHRTFPSLDYEEHPFHVKHPFHYCPERRHELSLLETCQLIRHEAQPMAFSMTTFHLPAECAYPDKFALRIRTLSPAQISSIRNLTLIARITQLRALNEAWCGLPFAHSALKLDMLTIVPERPDIYSLAYVEMADLSQSHTLAYTLCETVKSLRNVRCVEVHNEGCFKEVVWRLLYRSLVYRLWRWGGTSCGIRFQSGDAQKEVQSEEDRQWFRAWLVGGEEHNEVGEEVMRLVGKTGEAPQLPNSNTSP